MKKYIGFRLEGQSPSGKTQVWEVYTKNDSLGHIKWFGRWRCYAFFPMIYTIFERQCLRDIADFCESKTTEQRQSKKKPSI